MDTVARPEPKRRDWTVPLLAGTIALVILLAICAGGGVAAFLAFRGKPESSPSVAAPSPEPRPSPQDCLHGEWERISYVAWVSLFGVRVQLSGKGTRTRFTADGKRATVLDNDVISGTAQGRRYEVIHHGTLVANYIADSTTIHYSNPVTEGTTTWKVDGKVNTTEPLRANLAPDTYRCDGNDLRLFGEESATELRRVLPPGTPV